MDLHEEFISVLARKYGLKNPNCEDSANSSDKVGHILPETVGADNDIFEQIPVTEAVGTDGQGQQAQLETSKQAHILGLENTSMEGENLPTSPDRELQTSVQDTPSATSQITSNRSASTIRGNFE